MAIIYSPRKWDIWDTFARFLTVTVVAWKLEIKK